MSSQWVPRRVEPQERLSNWIAVEGREQTLESRDGAIDLSDLHFCSRRKLFHQQSYDVGFPWPSMLVEIDDVDLPAKGVNAAANETSFSAYMK